MGTSLVFPRNHHTAAITFCLAHLHFHKISLNNQRQTWNRGKETNKAQSPKKAATFAEGHAAEKEMLLAKYHGSIKVPVATSVHFPILLA